MPPLRLSLAAVAAAAAATTVALADRAYADSPFRLLTPHASASNPRPAPAAASSSSAPAPSGEFDPDRLERAAKALREINNSPQAKEVFKVMEAQEETRKSEMAAQRAYGDASRTRMDIENQRRSAEEQQHLVRQQAQVKAQKIRYEDELARKRMEADDEAKKKRNAELVKLQEQSYIKQEQARRATEEQIQAEIRRSEVERSEIERETIKQKALVEAEARAHEAKLTEDYNRRMLLERLNGDREKWIAAINTTFHHIGGGFQTLINDRGKLVMAIGGVTGLAAGVYISRGGAKVMWGHINRLLGQPSLIRESSIAKFPWSGITSRITKKASNSSALNNRTSFDNIILHPSLKRRIELLARATENTKTHQAPFRNMLFYGPPGTGKTMVARELARKSGLDYAMMTGGDVAPLGSQAVTKIHEMFDWAKKSRKGLLLFIDEADAFLCERSSKYMSEAQRSALNALLFQTGDQSTDIVLVLATNRPGDLDAAIIDRTDDVMEFPLPGEEERFKLLNLYLSQYISSQEDPKPWWRSLFNRKPQKITVKDLTEDMIREAAQKTDGFSGREIAKLMASIQAAVYGSPNCELDGQLFMEMVNLKVAEHHQRIKLASQTT